MENEYDFTVQNSICKSWYLSSHNISGDKSLLLQDLGQSYCVKSQIIKYDKKKKTTPFNRKYCNISFSSNVVYIYV